MKRCEIRRAAGPVPLEGAIAGPWERAEVLRIDVFPWYERGAKPATEVRALYDERNLYLHFRCEDRHIYAQAAGLNGSVYLDSCVEFFATVEPAAGREYFNLEMNCCGQMLMGFGRSRSPRRAVTPTLASRIRIVTSVPGPTKEESPADSGWWAAAAVSFEMLSEFTGRTVQPAAGTLWRGNFYRCGGKTDDQYACWSPIETPEPDFHRPEFFGELRFE